MSNDQKNYVMSPYHDMHMPFSVSEMGNYAEYIARDPDKFPQLILGSFALVHDSVRSEHSGDKIKIWIVGRVVELKAISPFNPKKETALYADDEQDDPSAPLQNVTGPHTHQPMIARIRLERQMLSEEESDNRSFVSLPVQRPPSAQSNMQFPDLMPPEDKKEKGPPSLQEMLDIPDKGLTLGYVGQGSEPFQSTTGDILPYKWNVDELDNKHIFIVGESGSGKTVLLKKLAYEIRRHTYKRSRTKPRVIMTDVQGDIAQLLTHDLEKTHLTPKGWQRKAERQSVGDAMNAFGPFRLVIPMTTRETTDRLANLKKLALKQGHEVEEIGLRMQDLERPSDVEYLYRVSSEQVAILLDKIAEELKTVNMATSLAKLNTSLKRLMDKHHAGQPKLEQSAKANKGGNANQSGYGQQKSEQITVGDTPFYTSTFNAARRALSSLEGYFDHHEDSMGGKENPLNKLHFDGTVIFYMDDLNYDERIMWEMQLVKWLYAERRNTQDVFVFFDEAHQIIPARTPSLGIDSKETFNRLRRDFELLAREGRKFGINLVLGTQSPQDLHPIVSEQCPTKIVMKISPQNALFASLDKELAGIASRFGAGQFFITSPFNGSPDWVRVHCDAPPLPHMSMNAYWDMVSEKAKKSKAS